MALNTYAAFLPYLQVSPRQKLSRSDVVLTFQKPVTLRSGRLWHGYDENARFEAAVKVWLNPKGSGSVYLGGVYQHRHNLLLPTLFAGTFASTLPIRNDYYELEQLRDLAPLPVPAGSTVSVDRDFFNIEPVGTPQYNAWDIELLLVVNE